MSQVKCALCWTKAESWNKIPPPFFRISFAECSHGWQFHGSLAVQLQRHDARESSREVVRLVQVQGNFNCDYSKVPTIWFISKATLTQNNVINLKHLFSTLFAQKEYPKYISSEPLEYFDTFIKTNCKLMLKHRDREGRRIYLCKLGKSSLINGKLSRKLNLLTLDYCYNFSWLHKSPWHVPGLQIGRYLVWGGSKWAADIPERRCCTHGRQRVCNLITLPHFL